MRVAGVVCEYNPFHAGHQYHLNETRKAGADAVVAVMSGNFVQRGECAMADKWVRAEAAVLCGADLVLDLPVPWATASAADFAKGAVSLLAAFGVDMLSFGCETDDVAALRTLCALRDDAEVQADVKRLTSAGLTYPAALERAVAAKDSRAPVTLLRAPNCVLALEYLRAIQTLGLDLPVMAVRRVGAAHDASDADGGFLSAAAIRALDNSDQARPYIPDAAFRAQFASGDRFDRAAFETLLLGTLRRLPPEEIIRCVDDRSGLADRILAARETACDLDTLYAAAKTKSVTMAKVKRELLRVLLGVTPAWAKSTPPYLRVLAANETGLALLKNRRPSLPVMTRHSDFAHADDKIKALYALQCRATDLFSLCRTKKRPCGEEQRHSLIRIENGE